MQNTTSELRPRLRPVEAYPVPGERGMFTLRDPTGIAAHGLTLSEPAMFILAHFDGKHTLADVAGEFLSRYGQPVKPDTLNGMVQKLREGLLLDGPEFEQHMEQLLADYRAADVRPSIFGGELGDREDVRALLDEIIPSGNGPAAPEGRIVGLVAPHLDYARGAPCYGAAYGALRRQPAPKRVCILGTNHFGRGTSVVATAKAFQTPLGVTEVDTSFLECLEDDCGYALRENELDHRREHSIELQVLCLQHVYGPDAFKIVPLLCHDPCAPSGYEPYDGNGVDLRAFADALSRLIARDDTDTLLVAGADLSHVGAQFGDTFELNRDFLGEVEQRDKSALSKLEASNPDEFVQVLADAENDTRICSAGCMFALARVLRSAKPALLRYHQAHTPEQQTCVTCSAMVYTE